MDEALHSDWYYWSPRVRNDGGTGRNAPAAPPAECLNQLAHAGAIGEDVWAELLDVLVRDTTQALSVFS